MFIFTEDGKVMQILSSPRGEHRIVQSFSKLSNGQYFLIIRSQGELLVRRIIL